MAKVYNVYHKLHPNTAVYIGRPSIWGNPFKIGEHGTREQVAKLYLEWIHSKEQKAYRDLVKKKLKGKDLVCYCAPAWCHGNVLLDIANS